MAEFVRQVAVAEEAADQGALKGKLPPPPGPPGAAAPTTDDTDMADAPAAPAAGVGSGWVAAEDTEQARASAARAAGSGDGDVDMRDGEDATAQGGAGGGGGADGLLTSGAPSAKAMGMGLGGVLESLRERGELKGGINDMVWGGRAGDRVKSKLTVLEDVFTGSDEKLAQDVEAALTRRDEFGRVLTPKEAYRQLCYKFHGIVRGWSFVCVCVTGSVWCM